MSEKRSKSDFTVGSIPAKMIRFMLPFIASNLFLQLYSLVDMVIVGRFVGKAGLSAVTQGAVLTSFVVFVGLGISNAGQTMISQYSGAGRTNEIKKVIGTMSLVLVLLAAVVSSVVFFARYGIISLLHVPEEAYLMAVDYIAICCVGVTAVYGYNIISAALRGLGDSRHPFVFVAVSSVLNIILDYLLTGLLGFGVKGAAWATVISQIVCFASALGFFYKRQAEFYFEFRVSSFHTDRDSMGKLLKLGIPLALQASVISISMMILSAFINGAGVAASATFGVGIKINDILNSVTDGVQFAAGPMIGQNAGAGSIPRIKKAVFWTCVFCAVLSAVFMIIYLTQGRNIFGLFTDDPDVMALVPVYISAIIWIFPCVVFMRGSSSFLQGMGYSSLLMAFAFLDAFIRVSVSWLLGEACGLGFYGFVLGFALAPAGVGVPGIIYFLRGEWIKKDIIITS